MIDNPFQHGSTNLLRAAYPVAIEYFEASETVVDKNGIDTYVRSIHASARWALDTLLADHTNLRIRILIQEVFWLDQLDAEPLPGRFADIEGISSWLELAVNLAIPTLVEAIRRNQTLVAIEDNRSARELELISHP